MNRSSTVLVVNSGSSSIKYQLVDPAGGTAVASGLVERIGEKTGAVKHTYQGQTTTRQVPIPDHGEGMRLVLALFDEVGPVLAEANVVAVGHRVVQGGPVFDGPALLNDEVVAQIDALSPLAPLHNPAHVTGMRVTRRLLPEVPQVAVFDTAFFRDLPGEAATYAIDAHVAAQYQVRRYGAHGTSHQYVSREVPKYLGRPAAELNQIVLHLGNGASASAVAGGKAIDTSMGLTPLEGLVMGTRSGDIDPAVVFHLCRVGGMSIDEIDDLLNRRSGIKGISGENDFRALHSLVQSGDKSAKLALDVYVHRLKKYIGAYHAVLGRLDVLVFTAGVGENDDIVRARTCTGLEPLGIHIDLARNAGKGGPKIISTDDSPVTVLVYPTNEELAIARQALAVVQGGSLA
ncbi:MAG: acetate kinase [Micrococcales bacterium]|nr:acetate kinase [Micrococcales bacterium]